MLEFGWLDGGISRRALSGAVVAQDGLIDWDESDEVAE